MTNHYIQNVIERYEDSFATAQALSKAIFAFVKQPAPETHQAAKRAWVHAHRVYSHSEVFRFGNPNVDEWEGKVNAWPLDEGLIDYVRDDYQFAEGNPFARFNLINSKIRAIDSEILEEIQSGTDPKAGPQGMADFESNVTIGYHAIEFLLWGQDQSAKKNVAGGRSHTDYIVGEGCTNKRCGTRATYLRSAAANLITNLRLIIADWKAKGANRYGVKFAALPAEERLRRIIQGMGELSFGELAGERMRVALVAGDQEEEQNCFSDTTHYAIHGNAMGIKTIYLGEHTRSDGSEVKGPSLSDLVKTIDPKLDSDLRKAFEVTMAKADALVKRAEGGEPFDMMIQPGNAEGHAQIRALIDALKAQTVLIEKIKSKIPQLAEL